MMSEQEKVNVSPCLGSPVVVVESATRHTSPYRPSESQDVGLPDSPQKRASCVTSISSERHKMAAKKLSSNIKRRDSASPVTVSMVAKETETKMEEIVLMTASAMPKLPSAHLPSPIPSTHKDIAVPEVEPPKKVPDDESITPVEIAEFTREKQKFKVPYWENDNNSDRTKEVEEDREVKYKGIEDKEVKENEELEEKVVADHEEVEYKKVKVEDEEVAEDEEVEDELDEDAEEVEEEENVSLQGSEEETLAEITLSERSSLCSLEETRLPGPCNSTGRPFAGNSDVTISLTKKPGSKASIGQDNFKPIQSGISITMKGSGRISTYKGPMDLTVATAKISSLRAGQGDVRLKVKEGISHYLYSLKGKLITLGGKINHALHF